MLDDSFDIRKPQIMEQAKRFLNTKAKGLMIPVFVLDQPEHWHKTILRHFVLRHEPDFD
ncbi:MAG: hypothetical protein ABIN95_08985 [Mucilaginibacter sp.]